MVPKPGFDWGVAQVVDDLSNPLWIHPQSDALSIELLSSNWMAERVGHTPFEIPVQIPPPQYFAVS